MKSPLVSIHVVCYNRSAMLKECIESFIAQTFTDWELVLADDGSEENLTFVVDMDERIKYFRQEHLGEGPRGIAAGFNLAVDNSVGKYLVPFGSDDLALPNLLERLIESIGEYDVAYCDHWIVRSDGTERRKKHGSEMKYEEILKKQTISHGGMLWRRDRFPRYDETLGGAEDWDLLLTALENGLVFKHIPERLWKYRVGHSREEGTRRQLEGCKKVLKKRGL